LVRALQALGSDKCLLSRVPVAVATIVARMIAGPLTVVAAIGARVAPAGVMVVLEARAVMAHRAVGHRAVVHRAVGHRQDAPVLVVARRPAGGRVAMTLAVIVGHGVRVGQARVGIPVARMDVTWAVAMQVAAVGLGAQAPTAARMEVVLVIAVTGPVAITARRPAVADAQMVVGAPRAQPVAAAVPGAEHVVDLDPHRDRDEPMGHAVLTDHDVPMARHRAAHVAVVCAAAVRVVVDARQVADAVALGDHQAMPVVVIVAQAVAAMQGGVVATVEIQRGHRVRNRARQRSVVRRRCVHAAAGCANHKMSPVRPSRNAGRTSARSMRSADQMRCSTAWMQTMPCAPRRQTPCADHALLPTAVSSIRPRRRESPRPRRRQPVQRECVNVSSTGSVRSSGSASAMPAVSVTPLSRS